MLCRVEQTPVGHTEYGNLLAFGFSNIDLVYYACGRVEIVACVFQFGVGLVATARTVAEQHHVVIGRFHLLCPQSV